MFYTRVAIKGNDVSGWRWNSATFTSLNTLFEFLEMFRHIARSRMRVFFASSHDVLHEMLQRENRGQVSNSVTVEEFWQQRGRMNRAEMLRLEAEVALRPSRQLVTAGTERAEYQRVTRPLDTGLSGSAVDDTYDSAYTFALPTSMREALAWATLLAKVQRGEIVP